LAHWGRNWQRPDDGRPSNTDGRIYQSLFHYITIPIAEDINNYKGDTSRQKRIVQLKMVHSIEGLADIKGCYKTELPL